MKKMTLKLIFFFTFFLFTTNLGASSSSSSSSGSCHSNHYSNNLLMPNFSFHLTPRAITKNSAFSLLGEAGRHNYRANGTYGILLNSSNRLKFSGEYLTQKLGYHFASGKIHRWVHQYGVGGSYEHSFNNRYIPNIEINGYYSHAPSKNLSDKCCDSSRISRHLAGSNAYSLSAGTDLRLWNSSSLKIAVDYDYVIYHRKYESKKHIHGAGGTVEFYQRLFNDYGLNVLADFRRPYNYYRASLHWYCPYTQNLSLGVYSSYTAGKSKLPNNTVCGIELSYAFSGKPLFGNKKCSSPCYGNMSDFYYPEPHAYENICDFCYPDIHCCENVCDCYCPEPYCPEPTNYCSPELVAWVSTPAVYIPEVLVIRDQKVGTPISSTPIPSFLISAGGPFTIAAGSFFSGGGTLTFSATGLPAGATIDPSTGVISGVNLLNGSSHTVTVSATNACATVTRTFTIRFSTCPGPTTTGVPNRTFMTPSYSYDVFSFFNGYGNPITFSISGGLPGATINPVTGVISGSSPQAGSYPVTVTATTSCGSVSAPFTITFQSV